MKKMYLMCLLLMAMAAAYSQTTYYWVGGAPVAPSNISIGTNWNSSLDGTGAARPSATGASDILVFNGTNIGGTTPTTGVDTVNVNTAITCAQIKFINNAAIFFIRSATGTSTMTVSGEAGEDFVIESGSSLSITSYVGSIVIVMAPTNTGRVSGAFSMITSLQARIANGTTGGVPGSFIFTSGSTFTTNITATSAAYPFGNNSQSSERWVQFQSGSTLFYNGGFSPFGSSATFSPVDFAPGSTFYMRASNPVGSGGTYFNRKSFPNMVVDNGSTLTADGPIYRIDTLTINSGATFITHTAGQTAVLGNLTVNGTLNAAATSTNELVLAGGVPQTVSGSGTINIPSLVVADNADVILNKSITVSKSALVYGKLNFTTAQLLGAGTFSARINNSAPAATGTLSAGSYFVTGVTGAVSTNRGFTINGAGIQPNTAVVSFSANNDTMYLSKPVLSSGSNVQLAFSNTNSTLSTANTNGFDPVSGSIAVTDTKEYQPGINYTINGNTLKPFGISPGSTNPSISAGIITINAPATTNAVVYVTNSLQLNNKLTVRTGDTLRLLSGVTMPGTFDAGKYIITDANTITGVVGVFQCDNISTARLLPVGTAAYYMPVTITPTTPSGFTINVFQGITTSGTPNGTPFTTTQKQTVVDAVWNINRYSGTGSTGLQLQWNAALEGTAFSTFANSDIGIIVNPGTSWSLPVGPGNNTTNTASASFTSFGNFGIGAQPPAQPFIFNPIPAKTYGNPDFSPGVISSNTTTPIVYTSSNPAVATIVAGNLHIVGTGTTNITATQASDGFYPAANVTQSLVVNKANLTIKADDKSKPEGDPNPPLTATYTGFVYGETATVLTTQATLSTTATTTSPAGTYPITVSGAAAANYNISFVNGTMTVTPRQAQTITFTALPVKTYGNADFTTGATSTNATIPITYTSSNTSVATIVGNNIHIAGAGTTTITASQAGNAFYFAAPNVSQTLTVNKAALTVKAADTTRPFGVANPPFRLIYSGFVLGETISNLTTQPTATTNATTNSAPGYYTIKVDGGVSDNYSFIYTDGRLTILPATGANEPNLQVYKSSSTTLTVKVFSVAPALATVNVYDFNGRLRISKGTNFLPTGFITILLPTDRLSSGIYFVKVIDNAGMELMKKFSFMR